MNKHPIVGERWYPYPYNPKERLFVTVTAVDTEEYDDDGDDIIIRYTIHYQEHDNEGKRKRRKSFRSIWGFDRHFTPTLDEV